MVTEPSASDWSEPGPCFNRTKALVLELLAAICLVKGGHQIILDAFTNFKEVCSEDRRFQTLMRYFIHYDIFHIEFMVSDIFHIEFMVSDIFHVEFMASDIFHIEFMVTDIFHVVFMLSAARGPAGSEGARITVQIGTLRTPVCRLCGRYLAILGRPIRVTVPAVTVAPTALVGSLIRSPNLPHSLQRGVRE